MSSKPSTSRKRAPPHDISVLLLDIGRTMADEFDEDEDGISDMNRAKSIAEWIISRKIFSMTQDEITLVSCGSAETENQLGAKGVHVHSEVFDRAKFDDIRFLKQEVIKSESTSADLLQGIIVAIDLIRNESMTKKEVDGKQIVVFTNGKSNAKANAENELKSAVSAAESLGIDVVFIGVDEALKNGTREPKTAAEKAIKRFEEEAEASLLTFHEAADGVSFFAHSEKAKRAYAFDFEVGPDLSFPVKSYVKTKYNPKLHSLKFVYPDEQASEVVRERYFVQHREVEVKDEEEEGKEESIAVKYGLVPKNSTQAPTQTSLEVRTFEKAETVKGYMFGKTRLIISDEEQKINYNNHKFTESKCLQLVQMAPKSDITEVQLVGKETRVFLPDDKADERLQRAFHSFASAALRKDKVAIMRYAYNKASNPCLLALFPYEESNGCMAFAGVRLAFYEDIRPFYFPPLDEEESKPTGHQLRLVDDLIDGMQLGEEEGTDIHSELIMQPVYQRICTAAYHRALEPNFAIDEETLSSEVFKKESFLEPNPKVIKKVEKTLQQMADRQRGFDLFPVEPMKRRRIEKVPESIDDLLEEVERLKAEQEESAMRMAELEEKKPTRKLTFREKAQQMQTTKDLVALRVNVETVLEAAEDDVAFFPRVAQMLKQMRDGAAQKEQLVPAFNEMLEEIRDGFWIFTEHMTTLNDDSRVLPISSAESDASSISASMAEAFWVESKDVKP